MPAHPVTERIADPKPARRPTDRMPRWVKIFAVVAVIAVAVIAGLHLAGSGMAHLAHGDTNTHAAPTEQTRHLQ